jgi:hypothetical protein
MLYAAGYVCLAFASMRWDYDPSWPRAAESDWHDPTNGSRPTGIAFNHSSNETTVIYRQKSHGINETFPPFTTFNFDGEVVRRWGTGLVDYAHDLRIDGSTVWVMDMGDRTVNQIDPVSGKRLTTIGSGVLGRGVSPLEMSNVSNLLRTPDGALFVSDGDSLGSCNPLANRRILRFDSKAKQIEWIIGNNGTFPTETLLEDPHSLAYDVKRDWVWVTDRGNNRTVAFDAKSGKQACVVDLTPYGFTANSVRIDNQRQLMVLAMIPLGTHECIHPAASPTTMNLTYPPSAGDTTTTGHSTGPFHSDSSSDWSVGEDRSAIAVLDISDPTNPTTVFGPFVTDYVGTHAIDYDERTGTIYIAFLHDNYIQRMLLTQEE